MSDTRRLSEAGKDVVIERRSAAGLSLVEWHYAAYCSVPTIRRFLKRHSIRSEIFISICKAIGIEDWQSVAEPIASTQRQKAFAIFGKVPEDLDAQGLVSHLEKFVTECVSTETPLGTFIVTGYFSEKDQKVVMLILKELESTLIDGKCSIEEEASLIVE